MTSKQKAQSFPKLFTDEIKNVFKTKDDLCKIKRSMMDSILKTTNERFLSSGGCEKCNGRGLVVVWDTMDCMDGSYAEFGQCDRCSDDSKKVGLNKAVYSKYDRVRGLADPRPSLYGSMFESLDLTIYKLEREIEKLKHESEEIKKGHVVCVVKGRKVPVGIVGKVFYIRTKAATYGYHMVTTVGIKDKNQVVYWVNIDNIEMVFDQTILDEEAKNGNELLPDSE